MNTDTSLAPDAGDDVDADANAVSAAADSITPPAS